MRLFLLALPGCLEGVSVNQLAPNVKTTAPTDPYHSSSMIKFEESPRVHTFKVGDPVERREWIGMTKGQVVEVMCDESTVGVEWQVGFRLAGTRTTEQASDLRRSV